MIRIALYAFFFFFIGDCYAQTATSIRIYDLPSFNHPWSIKATSDGGAIMSGYSIRQMRCMAAVFKFSRDGVLEWRRQIYQPLTGNMGTDIIEITGGGYILSGHSGAGRPFQPFLVKLDCSGNIQWCKTLKSDSLTSTIFEMVVETSDLGLMISGQSYDERTALFNQIIVKTNLNGDLIWSVILDPNSRGYTIGNTSFIAMEDGSVFRYGNYNNDTSFIMRIGKNGQILWHKGVPGFAVHDAVPIKEKGWILCGRTPFYTNASTISVDLKGIPKSQKLYGKEYYFSGIGIGYDNTLIITGALHSPSPSNNSDGLILNASYDGKVFWARTLNGPALTGFRDAIQCGDRGYLAAGGHQVLSSGSQQYLMLKSDDSGYAGCSQTNRTVAVEGTMIPGWFNLSTNVRPSYILKDHQILSDTIDLSISTNCTNSALSGIPDSTFIYKDVLGNDTLICLGDSFKINLGWTGGIDYYWNNGTEGSIYHVRDTGWIKVRIRVPGCSNRTFLIDSFRISSPFNVIPESTLPEQIIVCPGDSMYVDAHVPGVISYRWSDGDTNSWNYLSNGGTHFVRMKFRRCFDTLEFADSIFVDIKKLKKPSLDLGPDKALCSGDSFILNVSDSLAVDYLWSNNSTSPIYKSFDTGWHTVSVSYLQCNGYAGLRDSIYVRPLKAPFVSLPNDTSLCASQAFFLVVDSIDAEMTYYWKDMTEGPSIKVFTPGTYTVFAKNYCGIASDSILIAEKALPRSSLRPDTILCARDSISVFAGGPENKYLWEDNSTNPSRVIKGQGLYRVKINNVCGDCFDTLLIAEKPLPAVNLGPDTFICPGDTIHAKANWNDEYKYRWQDGSLLPIYIISKPGTYNVQVDNICGSKSDTIAVNERRLPDPPFLKDTAICKGHSFKVDAGFNADYKFLWENGDSNNIRSISDTGLYILQVRNICGTVTRFLYVSEVVAPVKPQLYRDIDSCLKSPLLDANVNADSYLWSGGQKTKRIDIGQPGIYWVRSYNVCGIASEADSIKILSLEYFKPVFIPTAFTPNFDALNNELQVHVVEEEVIHFQMNVYNRWGELVFTSSNVKQRWDGTYDGRPAPEGCYYWTLEIKFLCSRESLVQRSGVVTLLR